MCEIDPESLWIAIGWGFVAALLTRLVLRWVCPWLETP
jgi:hypothetical protein